MTGILRRKTRFATWRNLEIRDMALSKQHQRKQLTLFLSPVGAWTYDACSQQNMPKTIDRRVAWNRLSERLQARPRLPPEADCRRVFLLARPACRATHPTTRLSQPRSCPGKARQPPCAQTEPSEGDGPCNRPCPASNQNNGPSARPAATWRPRSAGSTGASGTGAPHAI
jgi:hypothetical protein